MVRVMVVDDSPAARSLLVKILQRDPHLEVIGECADGKQAVRMAARLNPDVITMDIYMPVMDGYEATRTIMEQNPRPIVLVSASHNPEEISRSFRALEAGALTVLAKPPGPSSHEFAGKADELARTVRAMAQVKVITRRPRQRPHRLSVIDEVPLPNSLKNHRQPIDVVAIGTSTGGPAALSKILAALPRDMPVPILIVQHIARGFEHGLVEWLNRVSPLTVRLAADGDELRPGLVLISPNDRHLGVSENGSAVALSVGPSIKGHRPSATHLFRSVASAFGPRALGVVLTGIGDDGAPGLVVLKEAGGVVFAQDQASCVVFGMPRAAINLGVTDRVLPLQQIATAITRIVKEAGQTATSL